MASVDEANLFADEYARKTGFAVNGATIPVGVWFAVRGRFDRGTKQLVLEVVAA